VPLYRSREHRLLGGVCGGIAEVTGFRPNVVRIAYVVLSVLSAAFPGLLVYVILWVALKPAPRGANP
jgi:phage shock protein C